MSLQTPLTDLFKIKHPIMLAGMNVAAGPELAAAVTNAGGIGVIGGVGYTPKFLRDQIHELKEYLNDKNAPFGIDLLLPQVGGSARKTNKDYTGGKLHELVDIIIEEKAALFVCAVGVPPKDVVDKLHKAGIVCANMVGAPKHCLKALETGADVIIAQGGEGGGHTGDPACVDIVKGRKSPLTGKQVPVVAAGGIYNGRSLAAALSFGAVGVWVGTRFVCAEEAGASKAHQEAVLTADHNDTIRSLIYTGRPLRIRKTPFVMKWETEKAEEQKKLLAAGKIPVGMEDVENRPHLMGAVAAVIKDVRPAKSIMEEMIKEAVETIQKNQGYLIKSKL
ncbi:BZ3500_MvSof-1268-A1-R1_Chr1-3g02122 [Microbotryum saponariae]|uniref:BZ3500_MvSof-1268-A1-R1_Chr1-3g02122 protein n=1 Tax=Microbotryum saponariae TaxID=289078 RepID=A0A2X0MTR3_9BASI|nr:BZ3500_MvSof-1268-A1-R1_Chr1-3g02122 [Microbotryum saponariae]SCZ95445.1 BZ3501_MvSof-1269-A2-R1_Chr1-3g01724 [Microbotryum saponariae]